MPSQIRHQAPFRCRNELPSAWVRWLRREHAWIQMADHKSARLDGGLHLQETNEGVPVCKEPICNGMVGAVARALRFHQAGVQVGGEHQQDPRPQPPHLHSSGHKITDAHSAGRMFLALVAQEGSTEREKQGCSVMRPTEGSAAVRGTRSARLCMANAMVATSSWRMSSCGASKADWQWTEQQFQAGGQGGAYLTHKQCRPQHNEPC